VSLICGVHCIRVYTLLVRDNNTVHLYEHVSVEKQNVPKSRGSRRYTRRRRQRAISSNRIPPNHRRPIATTDSIAYRNYRREANMKSVDVVVYTIYTYRFIRPKRSGCRSDISAEFQ